MDRAKCLIFIKDEEQTESILSMSFDKDAGVYQIRFNSNEREYKYKPENVKIYDKPTYLNPDFHAVFVEGSLYHSLTGIYRYEEAGYVYLERGEKHYLKEEKIVKITHSVLTNKNASNVFSYLKEVSAVNNLRDENGERILYNHYKKIDFIDENSVLASYLSGNLKLKTSTLPSTIIYPFGVNRSQKKAVLNALTNKLSVVQGPPGTGKTQTILTIIANLVVRNKTVEIVSNNNSAVDNVKEKLERYGLDFILASLGSSSNKQLFISSQTGKYPDIKSWKMSSAEMNDCCAKVREISKQLDEYYQFQETLQKKKMELSELETEMKCFTNTLSISQDVKEKEFDSSYLMELLQSNTLYFQKHDRFSFLKRVLSVFFQRSMKWSESGELGIYIIQNLQWRYYCQKKKELVNKIEYLLKLLSDFDMKGQEKLLSELSMKLFKGALYIRVKSKGDRPVFSEEDLWKNPNKVVEEYPVVTSTAFSSASSLAKHIYDYVIIDEASQCDVAVGALSLLSAYNAVIVGDTKQLENVVTEEDRQNAETVFKQYSIPKAYEYSSFSFLASILELFPEVPSVMLAEHYRCQPRIIDFCNKKFYKDSLVIMTNDEKKDAMGLYLTPPGSHRRGKANLRQAEVIAKEILPTLNENAGSIGIITPYNDNVDLIREVIARDDIKVDTIHSFQGREMDTIIFSTADDVVTSFSDSPMLINVAVSRAKTQFILVACEQPQPANSNMFDLISYISYQNFRTVRSNIVSVFDMLYEQSTAARMKFLSAHRKVSEYDSENIMFALLEKIIASREFKEYGFKIACHYPLRYLFKDRLSLSEEERAYISHENTHVDFLIYRAIGKVPVVGIEVDGYHYHKIGSRQHERDILKDSIFHKNKLHLLRFKTNGSAEAEQVSEFLKKYLAR